MTPSNSPDEKLSAADETPPRVESLNSRRRAPGAGDALVRRQVPAEDLEQIVRRAAELQNKRGNSGSQLLTEDEVIEIGRQVGLQPDHVRRAMAEIHAESLAPTPPPGNRMLDAIAGDSRAEVRRVVAGNPVVIQQQIELQLRDREKLSALRRRPTRSVWEASGRVIDRVERFMNLSGKEYTLAESREVHLAVSETEPGWSVVTLSADLTNKRDELLYTAGSCVAVAAILAAVFVGEELGYTALVLTSVALLAGLAAAAIGIPWVRRDIAKRRARVELLLEGLVDQVDR